MMNAKDIEDVLAKALKPQQLIVQDDSGRHKHHKQAQEHGGGHFSLEIVCDQFEGKSPIERHQLIYGLLGMPRVEIHALSIVAKSSSEVSDA